MFRQITHETPVCPLTATYSGDARIVVLTVSGIWDEGLGREMAVELRQILAGRPIALIIDLTPLHDIDARSVPVWTRAQYVGMDIRPCVMVALCAGPESPLADQLQRLTGRGVLPVYAKVRQARVALHGLIVDRPLRHDSRCSAASEVVPTNPNAK